MTDEVSRQVIEFAQPGADMEARPGNAIATIAAGIGNVYAALGPLIGYIQNSSGNEDAQKVGRFINNSQNAITGLEGAVNAILGVSSGKIVQGGVVAHAWMLEGAAKVTGDSELITDPEKVRYLARNWKNLDGPFKSRVQSEMDRIGAPLNSIAAYADLDPTRQKAYALFDELIKCGGRGVEGHGHEKTKVPSLWVDGSAIEEKTEADRYLNSALSSDVSGGIAIGGYSSNTCAWDALKYKSTPGSFAMISEKATALSKMFGSIELSNRAPEDITGPLGSIAQSYESIARAAAPSLYSLQPVTNTSRVKGL